MRARQVVISAMGVALGGAALWILVPVRAPQPEPPLEQKAAETAPQTSAPPRIVRVPAVETNVPGSTHNVERWPDKEPQKLTAEQAEAYLRQNHRNAASLLAASRTSGNKAYLREAMEKFPKDPHVAFDAYFFTGFPHDRNQAAPAERRQWLETFKQSDPNNSLPDYLAARDDFRGGRTDIALQELQAAAGKSTFDAYLADSLQSTEEAYRSAGFSEADAKSFAAWNLLLPHLSEMKQLSENIADLATQYQRAGDTASAQAILQVGMNLGDQLRGPAEFPLIDTLVGVAVQKKMLGAMDPSGPYLDTGMTVQNQMDALEQFRQSLKSIGPQVEALLPQMSDADRVSFYDRLRAFGEPAAVRWAAEKYGGQ